MLSGYQWPVVRSQRVTSCEAPPMLTGLLLFGLGECPLFLECSTGLDFLVTVHCEGLDFFHSSHLI